MIRLGRTRLALVALIVGAVVSSSACWPTSDPGPGPIVYEKSGERKDGGAFTVAVIGDSITNQSRWALQGHGEGRGWFVNVTAKGGVMTHEQQPAAEAIAASRPQVVVVQLGTNDQVCALQTTLPGGCRAPGFTLDTMVANLWTMARTVHQPGVCVVGVAPYSGILVGQVWQEIVAAGDATGVADWKSLVTQHHDRFLADELGHLTPEGEDGYGGFIMDEVQRICGATSSAG